MRLLHCLALSLTFLPSLLNAQGTLETEVAPGDFAGPIAVEGLTDLRRVPRLRFCDLNTLRLGYLDGEGEVTYLIPLSGRPDTTSIQVASVQRVSSASLRSAAARYLATCRFDAAKTRTGPAPALVRQRLKFSSRRLQRAFLAPPLPVPVHPDSTDLTLWDVFALGLDEIPRPLACRPPNLAGGRIQIRFVVDTAGVPEPKSVEVLTSTSPQLSEHAVSLATSCRFVPGRADGLPVRVRLSQVFLIKYEIASLNRNT